MSEIVQAGGSRVLVLGEDGPPLAATQDFLDVIGELWGAPGPVSFVAIPVARLAPEFFELRSGLAGEALQKFVNYRVQVAVVGELSAQLEASSALRDFVHESNAGAHVWFVRDLAELRSRLEG